VARRLTHNGALDGLRGVAVLLVLMRHSFELVPGGFGPQWLDDFLRGGYFGVDIFFVLSGFLITSLLLDERESSGAVRMRSFYGRRALRLMPALVVMLGVVSIVLVLDGSTWSSLWPTVRSSLFYYQNWHSVWDETHLAAEFGHLWSLSIEEQFYIVWPVVLLAMVALWKRQSVRVAALALGVLWVVWYRIQVWNSGVGWAYVFVRTDTRIDALLIGCLVAFLFQWQVVRARALHIAAWGGLAVVLATVARTNPLQAYVYKGGLTLGAIGVGCMVLAIAEGTWRGARLFDVKPLRAVGKVSYGLYLWHFPVFVLLLRHSASWNSGVRVVVGVVLSGVVTALSWYVVERPALKLKDKWFARSTVQQADLPALPATSFIDTLRQRTVRMLIAVGVGAGVTTVFTNIWPEKPLPMTNRMGYALVNNFPLDRYWQVYLLWMFLFPAVVLAVYIVLPKLFLHSVRMRELVGANEHIAVRVVEDEVEPVAGTMHFWRVALVAGVFGYECAVAAGRQNDNGWWILFAGATAYIGLIYGAAKLWKRTLSAVNLFGTAFVLFGAWWVSSTTEMLVASTGERRDFSWLPLPVVVVVVVALLISDVVWGKRNFVRRERQRLTFVVVPVFLFIWTSSLPNSIGYIDIFHHGESLNGGWLLKSGWVPWRDFFFNIGFYGAAVVPRVSFGFFGTSYWGFSAGIEMLFIPLLVVAIYIACASLASRYWMALVGLTLTLMFPFTAMGGFTKVLAGDSMLFVYRFASIALITVGVLLFVRKTTWVRALFFGAALTTAVIAGSEMVVFATAACVTIFLRDAAQLRRWRYSLRELVELFRSTLYAAGGVVASIGVASAVMLYFDALKGYVNWWRIFPFQWYIETGVPFNRWPNLAEFAWGTEWIVLFAVSIAILSVVWFVVWRIRSDRTLRNEDWVAIALAIGNLLFMQKTLNRPDSHFLQSLIVSMPLLFYVVTRVVGTISDSVQAAFHRTRQRASLHTVVFGVLTVALLFPFMTTADVLNNQVHNAGAQVQPVTAQKSQFARMGYSQEGEFLENYRQLRLFLKKNIGLSANIYDFGNVTTVYNFLLNKKPLSRYSYVLQASTDVAQKEVIDSLSYQQPEVVSYGWDNPLNAWDEVSNSVRHWAISEYLLRNYSPWKRIGGKNFGNLLFLRNDLAPGKGMPLGAVPAQSGSEKAATLRSMNTCNWGVSSNYLTFAPTKPGVPIKSEPVKGMLTVFGWAKTADDEAVTIDVNYNKALVFSGLSSSERDDLAIRGVVTGKKSGFRFDIPVTGSITDTTLVTVEQVNAAGVRTAVPFVAAPGVNDATGEYGVQLDASPDGKLQVGATRKYVERVTLPENYLGYNWIVAQSDFGFSNDSFSLYDAAGDANRSINFSTLRPKNLAAARVSSCPTWYGWESNVVYLQHDKEQVNVQLSLVK
jgi:peptidoglycan/LPS O-acetylase OafA/YrhL